MTSPCARHAAAHVAVLLGLAFSGHGPRCATATQQPDQPARRAPLPEGESWHVMRDGQQQYGSVHTIVRRLSDDRVELTVTSRTLTELYGKRQEHGSTTRAVVDRDLQLLEFDSRAAAPSGPSRIEGRRTPAGFVLVEHQDGKSTETDLAGAAAADLVVDVALPAWLHRKVGDAGVAGATIRTLVTASGGVATLTARRTRHGADGSVWEIGSQGAPAPTVLHLDVAGDLVEQVSRFPPMRLVRCSAAETGDLTHRRMPDRELLVFKPAQQLPPAVRLLRVVVDVAWRDIDPTWFHLTDSRQRVVSLVTEGGRTRARLELERAAAVVCNYSLPVAADAQQPASEQFASALADSDFVLPSDPGIAAQARAIVGAETSALAAARKLCAWVHAHIHPTMIAETLSGPEVLARRTGKCTEYSTLFGSLARAVGIPTRLVLGQRRFVSAGGDNWGGHMWNEVFVGEWIPVDATVDECGGSPALLKLVHSDSVAGTQVLRWLLTESLELSIVEHGALPAPAAPTFATGVVGNTYSNAEHTLRLTLPNEQWVVTEEEAGGGATIRLRPPAGVGASAHVYLVVFPVDAAMAPRTILNGRLAGHEAALADLAILDDVSTNVAGCTAHRIRFEGTTKGGSAAQRRVTEVLWIRQGKGYLFQLQGRPRTHEAQVANFEAMLLSFTFADS